MFASLVDSVSFTKKKPGIRFTEKMVGKYSCNSKKQEDIPCEFTLTIESDDVEKMVTFDPNHVANISGTVTCSALSFGPMTVSQGKHLSLIFWTFC